MKTRTKLNIAGLLACALMWLKIGSHILGIPEGWQWMVILASFVALGFWYVYIRKAKQEKQAAVAAGVIDVAEVSSAQNAARKRLITIWLCMIPFTLSFPFWMPLLSGIHLGFRGDIFISLTTLAVVSTVFGVQIQRMPTNRSGERA